MTISQTSTPLPREPAVEVGRSAEDELAMATRRHAAPKEPVRGGAPRQPGRFAAIDFETADHGRDSACSLGVVVVEGLQVVGKAHFLIRPPRRQFVFSWLHGITWADVADKPPFREVWPEALELLGGVQFIAAHAACQYLGIPLHHHRADSDALACARIVIAARSQGIALNAPLGGYGGWVGRPASGRGPESEG